MSYHDFSIHIYFSGIDTPIFDFDVKELKCMIITKLTNVKESIKQNMNKNVFNKNTVTISLQVVGLIATSWY